MAYNKSADGSSMKRRPMRRKKKKSLRILWKDNVIDYKDTNKLKRYISERGEKSFHVVSQETVQSTRALTVAIKSVILLLCHTFVNKINV